MLLPETSRFEFLNLTYAVCLEVVWSSSHFLEQSSSHLKTYCLADWTHKIAFNVFIPFVLLTVIIPGIVLVCSQGIASYNSAKPVILLLCPECFCQPNMRNVSLGKWSCAQNITQPWRKGMYTWGEHARAGGTVLASIGLHPSSAWGFYVHSLTSLGFPCGF